MIKLVLVLFCFVSAGLTAKFPSEVQKCDYAETSCIIKATNEILVKHSDGFPSLNLPPLDPLKIEKLDIVQGGDSPINIVLNFRNVDLTGLKNTVVEDLKGFNRDAENDKIEFKLRAPVLSLVGNYKISGRVLVLPIQGNGRSNMTMANMTLSMKFTTKTITKNNKDYIQIDKYKLNFDTTRFYMDFSNLFNGDKALGDNMNLFLNENWQDILNELKPAIVDAFAQIFKNVVNGAISKYPHKDMFLVQ